jgi:hypothetical protein
MARQVQGQQKVEKWYSLDPGNKYKLMWDVMMNSIYVMSFFIMPLVIAFQLEPLTVQSFKDFELFVDFMMLIDIFLTFVTAFYDDIKLEQSLIVIGKTYLTSYFLIDFLACIPSILVWESKAHPVAYYLKLFRFL